MNNSSDQRNPAHPPMKWHNFLIYIGLWVNMIVYALSAYMHLACNFFLFETNFIYRFDGRIRFLDCTFGFVLLGLAIMSMLARSSLAGFKANGPKLLIRMYAAEAIANIIYPIIVSIIFKASIVNFLDTSCICSVLFSAIMFFFNRFYYTEHSYRFVN